MEARQRSCGNGRTHGLRRSPLSPATSQRVDWHAPWKDFSSNLRLCLMFIAPPSRPSSRSCCLLMTWPSASAIPVAAVRLCGPFPAGKPQLFSDSPRALSNGVLVYAFGRRMSPLVQRGIAFMVRLPVIRRLVAERRPRIDPVCGWDVWDTIVQRLQQRHRSRSRSMAASPLSVGQATLERHWVGCADGHPEFFLMIEAFHASSRGPLRPVSSFRVPACTASFRVGDWYVRQHELLPRYHRPADVESRADRAGGRRRLSRTRGRARATRRHPVALATDAWGSGSLESA